MEPMQGRTLVTAGAASGVIGQQSNRIPNSAVPRDLTTFEVLSNELELLIDNFSSVRGRLQGFRERALGCEPGNDKAPSVQPVPNGHVAQLGEKLDLLKRIYSGISEELSRIESLG